ncbi:MAG: SPFH domain-containing protein, partial [Algisphaera sp.]
RINAKMAAQVFADTGSAEQAVEVHLVPALRSLIREQGKTIKNAQDFFNETTQQRLQENLYHDMKDFLADKGIDVSGVFIRDIQLPAQLRLRIEEKKAEEQELARTEFEQQRKVVQAKAEREAAEEQATMRRTLADAQAYEITKINEAISTTPAYIQLQALEALKAMSKDPAAKIYFMDSNAPMPLPLMNVGQ